MSSTKVVFWDVQHGSASYISTPNNRHIVVDLGVGSYTEKNLTFSPLLHLKNKYNVNKLDFVLITHPHRDHIDDILNFELLSPSVLLRPKNISKEDILKNVSEEDKAKFLKYFEINDKYIYTVQPIDDITNPDNYGGLQIKTYSSTSCSTSNINNQSFVMIISYASVKIVFTGDNESCSWNELMKDECFINDVRNSHVFLAPHHGRESGYNSDLLNIINPYITIVSDGRCCDTSANNRYSAKSQGCDVFIESKNKYEKRKCLTTNNDGVITIDFGYNNEGKPFLYISIN